MLNSIVCTIYKCSVLQEQWNGVPEHNPLNPSRKVLLWAYRFEMVRFVRNEQVVKKKPIQIQLDNLPLNDFIRTDSPGCKVIIIILTSVIKCLLTL